MRSFCLLLIIAVTIPLFSQETIEIRKNRFYHDNELLIPKQIVNMMTNNLEALALAKKAESGYNASNVLGFIGGFMIGWPVGTAIGGGEPEWAMAGVGAGLLVVALPIASSSNKKMKEAVNIYNKDVESSSRTSLNIQMSGNSVGLQLKF